MATSPLSCPLPQSAEFARACRALGTEVARHEFHQGGALVGVCNLQRRRLGLLGEVALISRGPVFRAAGSGGAWPRGLMPDVPLILNAPSGEDVPRGAGFVRLFAPVEVALLPLGTATEMRARLRGKWRNRLNRAEPRGLKVDIGDFSERRHRWLLEMEAAQQVRRRYRNWPPGFVAAYARANPGAALVATAHVKGAPVAGMLFLRHGRWATYLAGVTTPTGRAMQAHNLLLWKTMIMLAGFGHDTLDLGRLDGPEGLARFKRGTGARAVALGGTWVRVPAVARLVSLARRPRTLLAQHP